MGELLNFDYQTLSLMQMYRTSDALMKHRQAVEAHLFTQAMGQFDLQPTVTLFDPTNTFIATGLQNRQSNLFQLFNNVPWLPSNCQHTCWKGRMEIGPPGKPLQHFHGCAPYWLLIHSRSASSIRVCQPFPSARK